MNLDLSNPFLRAHYEKMYTDIAEGKANKDDVVREIIADMVKNYEGIKSN